MNGIYQKTPSMYIQLRLILLHYCMTVYICIYLYALYIYIVICLPRMANVVWEALKDWIFSKPWICLIHVAKKIQIKHFFEPFEILNCCVTGRNPAPLGMYKTLWKWDILDIHWLAGVLNHQQCSPCFPYFLQCLCTGIHVKKSTSNIFLFSHLKFPNWCYENTYVSTLYITNLKKKKQVISTCEKSHYRWPMHTAPPVKPRQRAPAQHTKKSRLQRTNLTWPLSKQPRFGSSYSDEVISLHIDKHMAYS